MQLQFSDSYILGVIIFMIVIWFARNMIECASALLTCLQQLCFCCDPHCIGYNAHLILKGCVKQIIVCFCFLQPVFLSAIVAAQRHRAESEISSLFFCRANLLNVYDHFHDNVSHDDLNATVVEEMHISCSNTDSIFVMMPYAVMTSINTLAWVSLTQKQSLSAETSWDASLFDTESDPAVCIYEFGYYIELCLLNFCALANSVHGVDFLQLFYCNQALTLCLIFFVTCARLDISHQADHLVAVGMLAYMISILVPFWYDMVYDTCETSIAFAMVHAFCLFILCAGHYLTTTHATVAYILTTRLLVTVVMSTTNLITLALGNIPSCQRH